jgi:hypothetical protein
MAYRLVCTVSLRTWQYYYLLLLPTTASISLITTAITIASSASIYYSMCMCNVSDCSTLSCAYTNALQLLTCALRRHTYGRLYTQILRCAKFVIVDWRLLVWGLF